MRQDIGLEEGIIVDCSSVTEYMTMTVTINKAWSAHSAAVPQRTAAARVGLLFEADELVGPVELPAGPTPDPM